MINKKLMNLLLGFMITIIMILIIGCVASQTENVNGLIVTEAGYTTFSFTIPNGKAVEVRDAFVWAYNYQETICNFNQTLNEDVCVDNPETKTVFTEKKIKGYIRDIWKSHQINIEQEKIKLIIANLTEPTIT